MLPLCLSLTGFSRTEASAPHTLAFWTSTVHNSDRILSHLRQGLQDAQKGVFLPPLSILLFVKNC